MRTLITLFIFVAIFCLLAIVALPATFAAYVVGARDGALTITMLAATGIMTLISLIGTRLIVRSLEKRANPEPKKKLGAAGPATG